MEELFRMFMHRIVWNHYAIKSGYFEAYMIVAADIFSLNKSCLRFGNTFVAEWMHVVGTVIVVQQP